MNKYKSATQTTEIKIYVADMAAYREGLVHGIWLDATGPVEVVEAQIRVMLANSPVDRTGTQWAIHDYQGFNSGYFSFAEDLVTVHKKALLAKDQEDLRSGLLAHFNGDYAEADRVLKECYEGLYISVGDYAQQYMQDNGKVSETIADYVDYEALGHGMVISEEIFAIELDSNIHVFVLS